MINIKATEIPPPPSKKLTLKTTNAKIFERYLTNVAKGVLKLEYNILKT